MASFVDQYQKREGVFKEATAPTAPPPEPKKESFLSKAARFVVNTNPLALPGIGGIGPKVGPPKIQQPAPAPTPAPKGKSASFTDQYDQRIGIFADVDAPKGYEDPEVGKKAGMASFLDSTDEGVRSTGERLASEPLGSSPLKLFVDAPTQAQLDNPRIAKAYKEAIEAQRPSGFVQTLKDAWESYSKGVERTAKNVAIGELGTIESAFGFAQYLGVESAKAPADKIQSWINTSASKMGDQTFPDKLAQGVGSSAIFFLPGLGVAKGAQMLSLVSPKLALLFGGSVSAALESMVESGNVYRSYLAEKKAEFGDLVDPTIFDEEASEAATRTFWMNAVIVTLTNRFGAFSPDATGFIRRVIMSAPIEGIQEFTQQLISNATLGREDPLEGTGESFAIGTIVGGLMAGGVEVAFEGSQSTAIQPGTPLAGDTSSAVSNWLASTKQMYETLAAEPGQFAGQNPAQHFVDNVTAQLEYSAGPGSKALIDSIRGIDTSEISTYAELTEAVADAVRASVGEDVASSIELAGKDQGNRVYRWAGKSEGEVTLGQPTETLGKGSYFALDPESSKQFGTTLETFALPKDLKILDLTKSGDNAFTGYGEHPLYRQMLTEKGPNGDFLSYIAEQGYDGARFLSDIGDGTWLALRPDIRLETATPTSVRTAVPQIAQDLVPPPSQRLQEEPIEAEEVAAPQETAVPENVGEIVLNNLDAERTRFEETGTAEIARTPTQGIAIKDEGDFIAVRIGPTALTDTSQANVQERSFDTVDEVFDFARGLQNTIRRTRSIPGIEAPETTEKAGRPAPELGEEKTREPAVEVPGAAAPGEVTPESEREPRETVRESLLRVQGRMFRQAERSATAEEFIEKVIKGKPEEVAPGGLENLREFYDKVKALPPETQEERVRGAVGKEEKSIKEVKAALPDIPEPTIRRILGQGTKKGKFRRVAKGVYTLVVNGQTLAYVETGDALEVLPRLANEGFKADMVFLDIPYDTPAVKGGNRGVKYNLVSVEEFSKVLDAVNTILRTPTSPVVYMYSQADSGKKAMQRYNDLLVEKGLVPAARGDYTKYQRDGVTRVRNMRGNIIEPEGILVLTKTGELPKPIKNLNFHLVRPKGYQTEKPAEMLRAMIEMTTEEGDTILDPFAGSGVTLEQAVETGRRATGIEINEEVVEQVIGPRLEAANVPTEQVKVGEVLTLKPEDLEKEVDIELERIAGEDVRMRSVMLSKARETVRRKVQIKGQTFMRPDQLVTRTDLRNVLKAENIADALFTVRTENDTRGQPVKYMVRETPQHKTKIRLDALGLISENIAEGAIIRVSDEDLKAKGKGLRAYNRDGALAFNMKAFDKGPDSPAAKNEVTRIVRRSEIAELISKEIGVPIRTGHFKQHALGIFKPWAHTIRIRSKLGAYKIPTVVHEVGHYLDYTMFGIPVRGKSLTDPKNWRTTRYVSSLLPRSELKSLLQEYGDGTGEIKSGHSKHREAFAEFIRYWTLEPDKAAARAPKFFDIWENRVMPQFPEIKDTLMTARQDWQRWNAMPAVAKVISQISYGSKVKTFAEVKDTVVATWHDTLSKWTDDLHPLKRFTDLAKKKGVEFSLEEDPYILSRLTRGWAGKATVFLEKGTFGTRFWEMRSGKAEPIFTGKGFAEIVAPIVKRGAIEDFTAYLVAKRSVELSGRGIMSGIELNTAEQAVTDLEKTHPEFIEKSKEIDAYQNALLQYAYQSGLIDIKTVAKMQALNKHYVPFYRVMEEAEAQGLAGKTIAEVKSPFKRIKGSDRDIVNPLESIVKNTYAIINASERNRAAMALVNLSSKHPELNQLFEEVPLEQTKVASVTINNLIDQVKSGQMFDWTAPQRKELAKEALDELGETIVNIFRPSFFHDKNMTTVIIGGKARQFQTDPDMYKALHGLDAEEIGIVWKMLSYPARWLRAGATLTPEFMVRNPARDMMSAYVYSEYGFMPPVDLARGLYGAVAKDNDFWLWRMGGGEQAMLVSMDRTTLKKTYEELAAKHDLTAASTLKKGLKYVLNPLESLRIVSEFSEKMTRLGEMKKAISRGANPLEAAYSTREVTLDFARIGSKARAMNLIVAFFNASIQASVRMVNAFKDHPYRTTTRTLFGITLPSILLALYNSQEDDWDEIPQWQKNLFWMVKVNDTWLRFPKPFELGIIFGSIPERIVEDMLYDNPEIWRELRKAVVDGASPSIFPTAILPIIENTTNYNFFLDRNIVPDSAEALPAFAQYTAYTSETAKTIGKWLNYSPAKIDNLVQGYFAGLGRYALQLIDSATAFVQGKEATVQPSPTAADTPVVRAFVVRDPKGSSSESLNRFYIQAEKSRAAETYYNRLVEKADVAGASEWYADHGAEIALSPFYEKVRANLATLRNLQNTVRDSRTLTADEKRQKIDEIGRLMTTLSHYAIALDFSTADAVYENILPNGGE